MRDLLPTHRPALVLAPMQDVTDLSFMRVVARRGAPDWFVTEYFRVHPASRLERHVLRAITENRTGRPVFAQLIGSDPDSLARTARELAAFPIAGIDINLGCPAPIVCRKNAGGGLLRDKETRVRILGTLRDSIEGLFTVKTRVGYETPDEFSALLDDFLQHGIDGLSVHGRTVTERYQTPVHPEKVRMAVETMNCPVIANGNIVDVATARAYHAATGAAGLMIGRGAIRNPWIFAQVSAAFENTAPPVSTHRDLWDYIRELSHDLASQHTDFDPLKHVQRMKKTLAYISHGLDGDFEFHMRRAKTPEDLDAACQGALDNDEPLPALPPQDSKLFCGFGDLVRS
ncbi:MAG: tRNA-dihydrouridine synthase family protein [Verrucomicrobiota bacterium]